jgi:hypothetical protein
MPAGMAQQPRRVVEHRSARRPGDLDQRPFTARAQPSGDGWWKPGVTAAPPGSRKVSTEDWAGRDAWHNNPVFSKGLAERPDETLNGALTLNRGTGFGPANRGGRLQLADVLVPGALARPAPRQ